MSTRNANHLIKTARLKAGYTQEQMAYGICSLQALSKIELGLMGVSSATFQTLMERADSPCECYPLFLNRSDFEVFYSLKIARILLDSNRFDQAYNQLFSIQERNYSSNLLNYQEWLLLVSLLKLKTHTGSLDDITNILFYALSITKPNCHNQSLDTKILSKNEFEIIVLLHYTSATSIEYDEFKIKHSELTNFLNTSCFSDVEKDHFLAELAIAQAVFFIHHDQNTDGIPLMKQIRKKMIKNSDYSSLIEITFLLGLFLYWGNKSEDADHYIKAALYSAHSIKSCLFTFMLDYLKHNTYYCLPEYINTLENIPVKSFDFNDCMIDYSSFSDGILNEDSQQVYTINDIIYETRLDNGISQQKLCQGLCSKSKLSKIENHLQQPSIILSETLLQRLGISERIFTFWSNPRETKFHDLKFELIHSHTTPPEERKKILEEFSTLIKEKDALHYQFFLTIKALYEDSYEVRIQILKDALDVTLPNIDLYKLNYYSLSWIELTILNNLAHSYYKAGYTFYSLLIFQQLQQYQKTTNADIMLQKNIFPITNGIYSEILYKEDRHNDNINFFETIDVDILTQNYNLYSFLLFYTCQSYGKVGKKDSCIRQAIYCINLYNLLGSSPNAKALEQYIHDDFSINLDY